MNIFRYAAGMLALWCVLAIANTAAAATWYVRADGGTALQCTGTADAPYPGSGTAQACAFSHPFYALQPGAVVSNFTPTTVMKPGDTLVIGSGSYMMGYGAPNSNSNNCYTPATWGCTVASIPSGIDAQHPTIVRGASCSAPPELWGTQRVSSIFSIANAHDIALSCLELTDHSNCIEFYGPTTNTGGVTACNRDTYPYGTWAAMGIFASNVTNLTLTNLNIHGFADYGINAGVLSGTTTLDNVTIRGNGWGGYSGDLGGNNHNSSNSGTIVVQNSLVEWNGCAENYPDNGTIVGCWGQNEGGYGDGFAESWTGGNWRIINTSFLHNTQDGLDLLYANGTGTIFMDRVNASFNAGNQVKTSGPSTLQNSVIDGYCNDWAGYPVSGDGSTGVSGTMCRAAGTPVVMMFNAANQAVQIAFNTITGNGDTLLVGGLSDGAPAGWQPNATNTTSLSNNVWLGQPSAIPHNGGAPTALDWYSDGAYHGVTIYTNNVVWNVKGNYCPPTSICANPQLVDQTLAGFNPTPLTGSPTLRGAAAMPPMPQYDFLNNSRPAVGTDIGAIQLGGHAAPFDSVFANGFDPAS